MGQLPPARVNASTAFQSTGIDAAGPFTLKKGHTRRPVLVKAYLIIFVCFSTKAVHIEVVSDLSTNGFVAALERFVSRRGMPAHFHTDNGSNFIGARNKYKQFYQFLDAEQTTSAMKSYLVSYKSEWHNIPERAPHFGGLWEAAVKSAKFHIKRVVGDQRLDFEEMTTVCSQIEACLNSRPLGMVTSHSPDGLSPLTPGHFLIGKALKAYPDTRLIQQPSLLKRWTLCQSMTQSFWSRWHQEYLQLLQKVPKWHKSTSNLKEGDLVLMTDGNAFVSQWTMGRVTATYPGKDGIVRAVEVMTKTVVKPKPSTSKNMDVSQLPVRTATYRRPITKLTRLLPEDYMDEEKKAEEPP